MYFIGAGPGDPDLLTIRGKNIIDRADVIIFAGSLVNPDVLKDRKADAKVYNSATMTLDEVIDVMQMAHKDGLVTARVHTGDPSLYGAHREQMDRLQELGIAYEVIPGVSSFLAAAASLGVEYTLPGVSQSLIISRLEGRTKVPPKEQIEELAKANTSMVLFLSAGRLEELCNRLMLAYPKDTPAAVVYKASWKEEKKIRGNLSDIADKAKKAGIHKTALLLVGNFLGDRYEYSKLYDKYFSHEYRNAVSAQQETRKEGVKCTEEN